MLGAPKEVVPAWVDEWKSIKRWCWLKCDLFFHKVGVYRKWKVVFWKIMGWNSSVRRTNTHIQSGEPATGTRLGSGCCGSSHAESAVQVVWDSILWIMSWVWSLVVYLPNMACLVMPVFPNSFSIQGSLLLKINLDCLRLDNFSEASLSSLYVCNREISFFTRESFSGYVPVCCCCRKAVNEEI